MRRVVTCRAQTPKKELNGREGEFSSAAESKISPSGPAGPLPKALRTSFANLFLPEPILINSHVFPYTLLVLELGQPPVCWTAEMCPHKEPYQGPLPERASCCTVLRLSEPVLLSPSELLGLD